MTSVVLDHALKPSDITNNTGEVLLEYFKLRTALQYEDLRLPKFGKIQGADRQRAHSGPVMLSKQSCGFDRNQSVREIANQLQVIADEIEKDHGSQRNNIVLQYGRSLIGYNVFSSAVSTLIPTIGGTIQRFAAVFEFCWAISSQFPDLHQQQIQRNALTYLSRYFSADGTWTHEDSVNTTNSNDVPDNQAETPNEDNSDEVD